MSGRPPSPSPGLPGSSGGLSPESRAGSTHRLPAGTMSVSTTPSFVVGIPVTQRTMAQLQEVVGFRPRPPPRPFLLQVPLRSW